MHRPAINTPARLRVRPGPGFMPESKIIPNRDAIKMENPPLRDGEWVFCRGRVVGCIEQNDGQTIALVEAHGRDGKRVSDFAVWYWPVDAILRPEVVKKEMGGG